MRLASSPRLSARVGTHFLILTIALQYYLSALAPQHAWRRHSNRERHVKRSVLELISRKIPLERSLMLNSGNWSTVGSLCKKRLSRRGVVAGGAFNVEKDWK